MTIPAEGTLDTTIIQAVATVTGEKPLDLPPLYESVEFDALETLVLDHEGEVHVEFEHAGCSVTVDSGTVTVSPS